MVGTPTYMAPEVVQGKSVGTGADVWALGVTCLHLLTGKLWIEATNVFAVLYVLGTMAEPPAIPEDVPQIAQDFLLECLCLDPNTRPGADMLLQKPFLI